jgi:hypothetical protein
VQRRGSCNPSTVRSYQRHRLGRTTPFRALSCSFLLNRRPRQPQHRRWPPSMHADHPSLAGQERQAHRHGPFWIARVAWSGVFPRLTRDSPRRQAIKAHLLVLSKKRVEAAQLVDEIVREPVDSEDALGYLRVTLTALERGQTLPLRDLPRAAVLTSSPPPPFLSAQPTKSCSSTKPPLSVPHRTAPWAW